MLKILQARLQQNVNLELPNVQAGFIKGRVTRDQIANSHWIIEKAKEFEKNIYFCRCKKLTMQKPLTVWIPTNCGKFLDMGILDHLTCLLRKLYAYQEATVQTRHGKTDWFKIGKGVCQGCILPSCLINLRMKLLAAQSCLTLCEPINYNAPGFSAQRNLMARILKWIVIPFSSVFS